MSAGYWDDRDRRDALPPGLVGQIESCYRAGLRGRQICIRLGLDPLLDAAFVERVVGRMSADARCPGLQVVS